MFWCDILVNLCNCSRIRVMSFLDDRKWCITFTSHMSGVVWLGWKLVKLVSMICAQPLFLYSLRVRLCSENRKWKCVCWSFLVAELCQQSLPSSSSPSSSSRARLQQCQSTNPSGVRALIHLSFCFQSILQRPASLASADVQTCSDSFLCLKIQMSEAVSTTDTFTRQKWALLVNFLLRQPQRSEAIARCFVDPGLHSHCF